jgi:multidrug efflux pump
VPVVLLGTLGILSLAGYSINTLTMFAMVLAIGLLVDDAIVVVENVERVMQDEGLSPRDATRKSMKEIAGALVGITTVLCAVFVPMAFFGGSTGIIYRQFSVTIISAMVLSLIVALVLTPALCATILRPLAKHGRKTGIFGWFNRVMDRGTNAYEAGTTLIIRRSGRGMAAFVVIVVATVLLFMRLPGSFLPKEDQGSLFVVVQLPVGATADRTQKVLDKVAKHLLEQENEAVEGVFDVTGYSLAGTGQNTGIAFISLKDFSLRKFPELSADAVAERATAAFAGIKDGQVFALAPPAIDGLGESGGLSFYLRDLRGAGREKLVAARDELLTKAGESKILSGTRSNGQDDTPQFAIDIDQEKASALGIPLADINSTLSIAWGSSYVNDFVDRGRVKRVYLQGGADFRMQPEDVDRWQVRNTAGNMVPFSAFATGRWTFGSPRLERYNGTSALEVQGDAAKGASSGAAMAEIGRIVKALPGGFGHEWAGLARQELLSGNQAAMLYALSVLIVFLCLAALYESWTIPLAVMLSVPIGILGAVAGASLFGQANDVYFKVGLLTTVGLAAKNAILVVEFAVARHAEGLALVEATIMAARQRLRPILMTSLAFILGVVPLAIASGAGSGAQNAIGIGVMGGMLSATVIGIFLVPLLFIVVRRVFDRSQAAPAAATAEVN